jgi:hypothetical protein
MPIDMYEARQLFFRIRSSVPFNQLYTWLNRVKFHLTSIIQDMQKSGPEKWTDAT